MWVPVGVGIVGRQSSSVSSFGGTKFPQRAQPWNDPSMPVLGCAPRTAQKDSSGVVSPNIEWVLLRADWKYTKMTPGRSACDQLEQLHQQSHSLFSADVWLLGAQVPDRSGFGTKQNMSGVAPTAGARSVV